MNKENIIRKTIDPDNLPPLTAKQIEMFKRLDAMTDEDIDYSDAPKHDFAPRPPKAETTLRLDGDVIEWLSESRNGADWKANSVLRHEMLRSRVRAKAREREAAAAEREKETAEV